MPGKGNQNQNEQKNQPKVVYTEIGVDYNGPNVRDPNINVEWTKDLRKFAADMRKTLDEMQVGNGLDIFRFRVGRNGEDGVSRIPFDYSEVIETDPKDHSVFWERLYKEACAGTLLVRVPGEEYPRQLRYTPEGEITKEVDIGGGQTVSTKTWSNGKLTLSDDMFGGIAFTGEVPERPGFFSRLLHGLGFTTESMGKYLRAKRNQEQARKITDALKKHSDRLKKDGTLDMERLPPEQRETILRQKRAEQGDYGRLIQRNNTRVKHMGNFEKNIDRMGELLGKGVEGTSYSKNLCPTIALLMGAIDREYSRSTGKPMPDETFEVRIRQMGTETVRNDVAKDLGCVDARDKALLLDEYIVDLSRVEKAAAANDVTTLGEYVATALKNAKDYCMHQIKEGHGIETPTLCVVAACGRLMKELEKPENTALLEAVKNDPAAQKAMTVLKGIGNIASAYLEGKAHQTPLLVEGSQDIAVMPTDQRKVTMQRILIGHQAQAVLTGVSGENSYYKHGLKVENGKDFFTGNQKDYENSEHLAKFEHGDVKDMAAWFSGPAALLTLNQRILGKDQARIPGKLVKDSPAKQDEMGPKQYVNPFTRGFG